MKTAKNMLKQLCPEKPTQSQTSPPLHFSPLLSISASYGRPNTTFPTSVTLLLRTCAHPQKYAVSYTIPLTPTSAVYSSHGAAGRGPGSARLAPFTVAIPAFPPASPAPTPHSARITPPNTHTQTQKELAEYSHYAASLRQQKKEQRTTKNKQGG